MYVGWYPRGYKSDDQWRVGAVYIFSCDLCDGNTSCEDDAASDKWTSDMEHAVVVAYAHWVDLHDPILLANSECVGTVIIHNIIIA